jgi:phage gp46-like protein
MFADLEGDQIGSKLWLLRREKQLPSTLVRYEEYARESLQWLIDDKVASAVTVSASYPETGRVDLLISIQRPQGAVSFKYSLSWNAESARE